LNAVLLADGLTAGGPSEARKRLQSFWHRLGHSGQLPVGPGQPFGLAAAFHLSSQLASPYQFNPLGFRAFSLRLESLWGFRSGCVM
jgi:NTE family protein